MRLAGPYADILRQPGAARFTAAAFIARLPISMVGLGIVLMVSALRGSYALAAACVVMPPLSYAVWRYGISDAWLSMRYGVLFREDRRGRGLHR